MSRKKGNFITREDVAGVWLIYVTHEGRELPLMPFAKGTPTADILQSDLKQPTQLERVVDMTIERMR